MGKVTGFLEIPSRDREYEPVPERLKHFHEFVVPLPDAELARQGARCMDCGIPFCHGDKTQATQGCPVNNLIPDWNDLVYRGRWREALDVLHSTNNFPEFTGRICPAPCEASCTLNIIDDPVTIKTIECAIIDRGWKEGWVAPVAPPRKTGKKVAVVGSGPAGMACAQQLARVGHAVTLFEKHAKVGGLLRYGIPDFKMEKTPIDRRVAQMEAEGVVMRAGVHVGKDMPAKQLLKDFDAIVLSGGAEQPRDLTVPGRELDGVHFAMEFLPQQNRRVSNEPLGTNREILAGGKHVVVIGGGDTGSDCIGTSFRQGAKSVTQLEIMPRPPNREHKDVVWPEWPLKFRTSSSQEEGAARDFSVATEKLTGNDGKVTTLHCVKLGPKMERVPGSEFTVPGDLVLLAMGFAHPVHEGMIAELGVAKDKRGNVEANTDAYRTSIDKVFAAGDMRRGQSLVVWAIREGRQCARSVDEYLMGSTTLPR
ncbi:MAG: glutamate synthase subunit beta [Alphaproteobacteria bacterium]|nr:glutamate synthase subunit beta [Alphaproteobacteria bacterium]